MLQESLRANDLKYFVRNVFEIDSFKSKIGNDDETVVISFTVEQQEPADDLENFIEMGYSFVLDADVTPGETEDGVYKVFVELERSKKVPGQIYEILEGVTKITGIDDWRFRYFKSFKSKTATIENLETAVPVDKASYEAATKNFALENFSNFFKDSYADTIELLDESIQFKRIWKDPISFEIITSGPKQEVYDQLPGAIMLESTAIAESFFLTKFIGEYNITKIGQVFVFENKNWAVALKRKI